MSALATVSIIVPAAPSDSPEAEEPETGPDHPFAHAKHGIYASYPISLIGPVDPGRVNSDRTIDGAPLELCGPLVVPSHRDPTWGQASYRESARGKVSSTSTFGLLQELLAVGMVEIHDYRSSGGLWDAFSAHLVDDRDPRDTANTNSAPAPTTAGSATLTAITPRAISGTPKAIGGMPDLVVKLTDVLSFPPDGTCRQTATPTFGSKRSPPS